MLALVDRDDNQVTADKFVTVLKSIIALVQVYFLTLLAVNLSLKPTSQENRNPQCCLYYLHLFMISFIDIFR